MPSTGKRSREESESSARSSSTCSSNRHKKQKVLPKDNVIKMAKAFLSKLPILEEMAQDMKKHGLDRRDFKGSILMWELVITSIVHKIPLNRPLPGHIILPEGASQALQDKMDSMNSLYGTLCDLYAKFSCSRSSPSQFALHNVWPSEQARFDGLLCLRPPEKRGAPLSVMHSVFHTFLTQQNAPLRKECKSVGAALRAAHLLCTHMGDSFEDGSKRSKVFDGCVRELFPYWTSSSRLRSSSEIHYSSSSHCLLLADSIASIIREDTHEMGTTESDVYLQLSRDYDLMVSSLIKEKKGKLKIKAFVKCGIPVFLVGLLGPVLLVAGGFYDGKNVIVEPLGRPCILLEDLTGRRQEEVARFLWSLHQGRDELQRIYESPREDVFPPDTPRLYPSCTLFGQPDEEGKLRFIGPLAQNSSDPHHLLYDAILSYPFAPADLKVVVKLVNNHYGEDVHQFLAHHHFAPILYGRSQLEDAPTAYVMEKLGSDWMSLFDLEEEEGALTFKDAIRVALDEILVSLEKAGFVHGDLRAINIMVEIDEKRVPVIEGGKARMEIIDFNWSGRSGQVYYPATRNEDIMEISWPGKPGGTINAGHDRQLVDSWWPGFLED